MSGTSDADKDAATSGNSGGAPGETLGSPVPVPSGSPARDPEEWVTKDDPMTGPQRSYLDNLATQAGEEISADLTKAEASEHIDRLQQKLGRGGNDGNRDPGPDNAGREGRP